MIVTNGWGNCKSLFYHDIIWRPEGATHFKNYVYISISLNYNTLSMSQSLSKLFVHIIFHVKDSNETYIRKSDYTKLHAYIGSIIKDNDSIPIIINGTQDHIHILCVQSKNIAISKLVEEIKRHSSRWLKQYDNFYRVFA